MSDKPLDTLPPPNASPTSRPRARTSVDSTLLKIYLSVVGLAVLAAVTSYVITATTAQKETPGESAHKRKAPFGNGWEWHGLTPGMPADEALSVATGLCGTSDLRNEKARRGGTELYRCDPSTVQVVGRNVSIIIELFHSNVLAISFIGSATNGHERETWSTWNQIVEEDLIQKYGRPYVTTEFGKGWLARNGRMYVEIKRFRVPAGRAGRYDDLPAIVTYTDAQLDRANRD